jgi:hypothetical protein
VEEYSELNDWAMMRYLGLVNLTPEDLDAMGSHLD